MPPFFFISSIIDFTVEETEEEVWSDDFKLDKIQVLLTIFTTNL